MKKIAITLVFLFAVLPVVSQTLNGAWRLVEKDEKPVNNEVIKLYSNSYFTYSVYQKNTGKFIEAGGGRYILDFFNYREHFEIDSKDPERSGKTSNYKAILEDDLLTITNLRTGSIELWEKFDDADIKNMATSWRIHMKEDQDDEEWRRIDYGPRKTIKMLTNNRYQVLALNSKTGEFFGSSGGTWSKNKNTYTEHVEFFSKNQNNVGRELPFKRSYQDGIWYHTGRDTEGNVMMEQWITYK